MLTIEQAIEQINQTINHLVYPSSPADLYHPIEYTLESGGKRIRPALTLLACDLFDSPYTSALKPAAGIEIFHNFTLLHDDIMDKAPIRRGKPTVHQKWDDNTAILSGDTMFAIAFQQFYDLPADIMAKVLPLFTKTAIEVCEGQQFDMDFEKTTHIQLVDYLEMIRLKTAVLIAASLKIGGFIAKSKEEDCNNLYAFGEQIGIAFQLQDDLLDTFGDVQKFGKSIGNDIRTNKNTFLKIKAFEKADDSQSDLLKEAYSLTDMNARVNEVSRLFLLLGVKDDLIEQMYFYLNNGLMYLDKINASEEKKLQLSNYATFMIERDY